MKTCEILICAALAYAGFTEQVQSEERYTQNMTVAFSNPERPGILKIVSGEGDITVNGYDGKDVVIDVITTNQDALPMEDEKAKGMKRITGTSFNVTKEPDENTIVITRPQNNSMDLKIKVPHQTSLNIGGLNNRGDIFARNITNEYIVQSVIRGMHFSGGIFEGDITVDGISGDIEVNTLDGDITLRDVTGGVTANSVDGDITAVFRKVAVKTDDSITGNPLALSTTDGDIDVTLPANVRATVTAKNVDGDIYTDYEMEIVATVQEEKPKNKTYVGIMTFFGNTVTGKINGGGADIRLTTIEGNIYIRKAK